MLSARVMLQSFKTTSPIPGTPLSFHPLFIKGNSQIGWNVNCGAFPNPVGPIKFSSHTYLINSVTFLNREVWLCQGWTLPGVKSIVLRWSLKNQLRHAFFDLIFKLFCKTCKTSPFCLLYFSLLFGSFVFQPLCLFIL